VPVDVRPRKSGDGENIQRTLFAMQSTIDSRAMTYRSRFHCRHALRTHVFFGSARFKQHHPYYKLARFPRYELARAASVPVVLMGSKFWQSLQDWGREMLKEGVFGKRELGFGRVTDSLEEAVHLVLRSVPPGVRSALKRSGS
jgi:predicted Rossmann-fold nucleotide-binding protein